MKAIYLLSGMLTICATVFAGEGWLTDLDEAKKQAVEQKKGILIEFTGSDWCPPCMQLRKDVMTKEDFIKAAQKDFILVELDYPRSKQQSDEVKKKNEEHSEAYKIDAFPTIVFADAKARPVAFFCGGRAREDVDAEMAAAVKALKTIMDAEKAMLAATGDDQFKKAGALGTLIPEEYREFYKEWADIISKDEKDLSGLKAKIDAEKKAADDAAKEEKDLKDAQDRVEAILTAGGAMEKGDEGKAVSILTEELKKDTHSVLDRQLMKYILFSCYMNAGDIDKGIAQLKEVEKLDPNSMIGKQVPETLKVVEEQRGAIEAQLKQKKEAQAK